MTAMLYCPSCQTPLVAIEFQKVELDYCPRCRGCWFDRNELGLLLHGDPAAEVIIATDARQPGTRACPRCTDHMEVARAEAAGLQLDLCRYGHGWWLDGGELRALINATAARPELALLSSFCDSVFGAAAK